MRLTGNFVLLLSQNSFNVKCIDMNVKLKVLSILSERNMFEFMRGEEQNVDFVNVEMFLGVKKLHSW